MFSNRNGSSQRSRFSALRRRTRRICRSKVGTNLVANRRWRLLLKLALSA